MNSHDDFAVCSGKKVMTRSEAVRHAKRKNLHVYRCPVAVHGIHFHVTSQKRISGRLRAQSRGPRRREK